jgi:hypothetical protein
MTDLAEGTAVYADSQFNPIEYEVEANPRQDLEDALSGICLRSPGVCEGVVAEGVRDYAIWVATGRASAERCAHKILEKAGCPNMIGRAVVVSPADCK